MNTQKRTLLIAPQVPIQKIYLMCRGLRMIIDTILHIIGTNDLIRIFKLLDFKTINPTSKDDANYRVDAISMMPRCIDIR